MNINRARILVASGFGLIGSTMIEQFLRDHNPSHIVILDNLVPGSLGTVTQALNDQRMTLQRGDIRDRDTVAHPTEGMDALVHMASQLIITCTADWREAMGVMYNGHVQLAIAA